jgi:hypothetical protein
MIEKHFEEKINYPALILLQINDIRLAIQAGNTGTIELEGLGVLIADELMEGINPEIEKINQEYEMGIQELLKSWTVQTGHPSNNSFKVSMSQERQTQLNRKRALANQRILHIIINTLYKKGMLITNNINLPSSLAI